MIGLKTVFLAQWLRGLRQAKRRPLSFVSVRALETTLEQLTDRLARTELALLQERHRHRLTLERMTIAEADLLHLQALLEQQRPTGARSLKILVS